MFTNCCKYTTVLCIYLLFCISVKSQDILQNRLDSFSAKLITNIRAQSRPRALLNTDKSIFKAGETIWFNALLLNSVSQKVSTQDKYLIVDLVNENDEVLKIVILDAAHQQLSSRIILPDSISTGYYWLRAYTRNMTKGDSDYCAIKSIYVFNPNSYTATKTKVSRQNEDQERTISMDFFPEGGSLITGANSSVAFYVHDQAGRPIKTEGIIKDNRDSITATFSSGNNGLGKFSFFPSRYRKYKALVKQGDKELSYPLPGFNFKAAQISVATQAAGAHLIRVLLEDSIYSNDFVSYVAGISKDSLCFASIGRGQYEVSVPDQKLREGITTFYLFDNNFKLLSERSIYLKGNNLLVNAVTDKPAYGKRKKVTLNVSVTDKNKQPVPALFSVAVADSMFSAPPDVCSSSYFSKLIKHKNIDNVSLAPLQCLPDEEIDLLMLLRNRTFQNIANAESPNIDTTYVDSLLYIGGVVVNKKNEPLVNKMVTLLSKSGNGIYAADTTDFNGRFYFPFGDYADSTQFHITVKSINEKNQPMTIIPGEIGFPYFKTPVALKDRVPEENSIARYIKSYTAHEAKPQEKKLPEVIVKKAVNYDVSKRISTYSSVITSDDIPEGTNVGTAVLGVAGMHLLNGFLVVNGLTALKAPDASSEPLLLVDGNQISLSAGATSNTGSPTIGYLNGLNSREIDFIEILKGPEAANYGLRGGNGVILVNTARFRKDMAKSADDNVTIYYAKGISMPAIFPSVNYDDKKQASTENPDYRSTIFWDGGVLSDPSGNTSFSFFTGDIPATYQVVISGITVHGNIVYKTLTLNNK